VKPATSRTSTRCVPRFPDLEREASREADTQAWPQLLSQIVEANRIEAPHSLVHRLMYGYAEMYKVPGEQLAGFEQQFHQTAETRVKRDLAMDALVEAHGLRATEAELDQRSPPWPRPGEPPSPKSMVRYRRPIACRSWIRHHRGEGVRLSAQAVHH
jgi:trigger factor protein